jgi:hypothetical protein
MIYGGRIPIQFELTRHDPGASADEKEIALEPFYVSVPLMCNPSPSITRLLLCL